MKMKTFSLILLICTVMLPFSAHADTLYLSGLAPNPAVDLSGHYYISPYLGVLSNSTGTSNISVYCVDPDHDSSLGPPSWNVNVTPLTSGSLSNTYLGDIKKYEEAAWLLFYYSNSNGTYLSQTPLQEAIIQAAVWNIINSSSLVSQGQLGTYTTQINDLVTLAGSSYLQGNYSNVYILSDTKKLNQEFMADSPAPVTNIPEPGPLVLLGSGLVGLWGFRRKFRK